MARSSQLASLDFSSHESGDAVTIWYVACVPRSGGAHGAPHMGLACINEAEARLGAFCAVVQLYELHQMAEALEA